MANIAEINESDEVCSSTGARSTYELPTDNDIGSPMAKARSARSSWIGGSRRNSRSGSVSARAPSRSSTARLTRSASSSDTSDIEADSMTMSMNRSMARLKRQNQMIKPLCLRHEFDSLNSCHSLLLSEPLRGMRSGGRQRHLSNRTDASDGGTLSASDTERELPFSAMASRCHSAAASVTFILGAVANEQTSNGVTQPNGTRRASLPQSESASMQRCCERILDAKNHATPVLQLVPFDQQKLPKNYRYALQMRLHNRKHTPHHLRHARLSHDSSLLIPVQKACNRRSASVLDSKRSSGDSVRKHVPPRIDEVAQASRDLDDSDVEKLLDSDRLQHGTESHKTSRILMGHASAPGTTVLSGNRAAKNHRHPLEARLMRDNACKCDYSNSESECSLPNSSVASVINGFKTPSVSSIRSDSELGFIRSGKMGGSCRGSRFISKRDSGDQEALLPLNNSGEEHVLSPRCSRCGSRRRGGSCSSHPNCKRSTARAPSVRSCSNSEQNASFNGSTASRSVLHSSHNKRNLLRSLFGQCFGCSIGVGGSTSSVGVKKRPHTKSKKNHSRRKNSTIS